MKNNFTLKLYSAWRTMLCSNYKLFAENLNRKLFMAITLAISLCSFNRANAQQTFNVYVANDQLISPNVYQFDVYLQATGTDFNFRTLQLGFTFNPAFIPTGSTVTGSLVFGSTQMNSYNPGSPQFNATVNALTVPANTGGFCSGSPANSNTTLMTVAGGPKRIGTFQLTSSTGSFGCNSPNISIIRPSDTPPALGVLRVALTVWTATCAAGTNSTQGTYTHFGSNTLYSTVNNQGASINDNNVCTTDGCDPSTGNVSHTPVNVDDNDACTTDGCDPSTGVYHNAVNTDDNDACTTDGCDASTGVYHNAVNTNDNDECTTDGCDASTGVYHNSVSTDDNNLCTTDGCDPSTGVYHNAVNTDDNDACTTDGCDPSTGVYHNAVNTNDNDECTTDGCDPVTGVYHNPVTTDDNDACTTDGCDPVTGVYHSAININDNDECTTDGCDPSTGVFHNPVTTNDNDVCTTDGCDPATGVSHNPVNTNDNNVCTTDGCDPVTGVYHNAVSTNDNNVCTTDGCDPVTGVYHNAVSTNDNNVCTTDGCDPITGVYHNPIPGCGCIIPACPGPISGNSGACKGQTGVVYSIAAVTGATTYTWTVPAGVNGATITSGQGGLSITVRFSNTYAGGNICVKANSACGSSGLSCKNVKVLSVKPSKPGNIAGLTTVCKGTTATYSIAAVTNATSYVWSVTGGLIITSGQGTQSITVSIPQTFSCGVVSVYASNCKGNSTVKTKNINGIGIPAQPCVISGASTACTGSAIYEYETCDGTNADNWTWSISPAGSATFTSQGDDEIYVRFLTTGTKTISVTAANMCGTSAPRTKTVTVVACRMENAGSISAAKGISENSFASSINLFPNPATNHLTIALGTDARKVEVTIADITGKIIYSTTASETQKLEVNTEFFAKGIYVVQIQAAGFIRTKKLIVNK